jgi:glycine hydroxymethyltransferase
LAEALLSKGFRLCTGGSDNHLILVDLRSYKDDLTGAQAETWLHDAGIVVNKNLIPYDPRSAGEASGIRIGTPALTTRGLREAQMTQIAEWMDQVLSSEGDDKVVSMVRNESAELCREFPISM